MMNLKFILRTVAVFMLGMFIVNSTTAQEPGWPMNAVKLSDGQSITIDGIVSEGEYAGAQPLVLNVETLNGITDPFFPEFRHNGIRDARTAEFDTPNEDFTGTYYVMWDDDNLYVAQDTIDDNYSFNGPDPAPNGSDALQFVLAESPDIPDTIEMFIPTLAPDINGEPKFKNDFGTWIDFIDLGETSEFAGWVSDDRTNWSVEIKIPFESLIGGFFEEKFPPSEGDMIGFSIIAIDFDDGELGFFATNHNRFPWETFGVERLFFIGAPANVTNWYLFE